MAKQWLRQENDNGEDDFYVFLDKCTLAFAHLASIGGELKQVDGDKAYISISERITRREVSIRSAEHSHSNLPWNMWLSLALSLLYSPIYP